MKQSHAANHAHLDLMTFRQIIIAEDDMFADFGHYVRERVGSHCILQCAKGDYRGQTYKNLQLQIFVEIVEGILRRRAQSLTI